MIEGLTSVNIVVKNMDAAITQFETLLEVKARRCYSKCSNHPIITEACFDFHGLHIGLMTSDNQNKFKGQFQSNEGEGVLLISIEKDTINTSRELQNTHGIQLTMPEAPQGPYVQISFISPKSLDDVKTEWLIP